MTIMEKKGPIVIGICGKAGVGKDTLGDYIQKKHGDRVIKISFAEPIKQIGMIFGFHANQLYDQTLKEVKDDFWGISPREFMQFVGT
jgi:pantothenate kinase